MAFGLQIPAIVTSPWPAVRGRFLEVLVSAMALTQSSYRFLLGHTGNALLRELAAPRGYTRILTVVFSLLAIHNASRFPLLAAV